MARLPREGDQHFHRLLARCLGRQHWRLPSSKMSRAHPSGRHRVRVLEAMV
jgi:hypothetical protein